MIYKRFNAAARVATVFSTTALILLSPINEARASASEGLNNIFSGIASWYGGKFHGRQTASGTVYDMNKMTCAHRSLPFGTKLVVKNPANGKQCEVVVTDRGPFYQKRVLDLSRAAASRIGISGVGTVVVSLGKKVVDGIGDVSGKGAITVASGVNKVAIGVNKVAIGVSTVANGVGTVASGVTKVATGSTTLASGVNTVAAGMGTVAAGVSSVASIAVPKFFTQPSRTVFDSATNSGASSNRVLSVQEQWFNVLPTLVSSDFAPTYTASISRNEQLISESVSVETPDAFAEQSISY